MEHGSMQLSAETYEQPSMKTYSEEELAERFADIFANAAVFSDTHGSPGM
jgi:hypothetical protein